MYSLYVCKPLVSDEEIKTFINKVLSPFLYYLISEHQKNRSESGLIELDGNGNRIRHSFFIFIDFLEPNTVVYKNLICLHRKGNQENFNFF